MGRAYFLLIVLATAVALLVSSNAVSATQAFNPVAPVVMTPVFEAGYRDIATMRSRRVKGTYTDEERTFSLSGFAKLSENIKSNPKVQKYVSELKTIARQLKNTAAYSKLIAKVEVLAAKVETLPGAAKIAELCKKLKFWMWYKLKYTPDEIAKKLKLGNTGGAVNTATYDEHLQYSMFYKMSKHEVELKKKPSHTFG